MVTAQPQTEPPLTEKEKAMLAMLTPIERKLVALKGGIRKVLKEAANRG